MTAVSSDRTEEPVWSVFRRPRTALWVLLLGVGVVVFLLRQGPLPQSIRLDLGVTRSDVQTASLGCTGPNGETARSQWSRPLPPELWLNWMATEGTAQCDVTLTGEFGSVAFEREVALDGSPVVLLSETARKRAVQSE